MHLLPSQKEHLRQQVIGSCSGFHISLAPLLTASSFCCLGWSAAINRTCCPLMGLLQLLLLLLALPLMLQLCNYIWVLCFELCADLDTMARLPEHVKFALSCHH